MRLTTSRIVDHSQPGISKPHYNPVGRLLSCSGINCSGGENNGQNCDLFLSECEKVPCFRAGFCICRSPPVSFLEPSDTVILISGTETVGERNTLFATGSTTINTLGYTRLIPHIIDISAQRWPIRRASLSLTTTLRHIPVPYCIMGGLPFVYPIFYPLPTGRAE